MAKKSKPINTTITIVNKKSSRKNGNKKIQYIILAIGVIIVAAILLLNNVKWDNSLFSVRNQAKQTIMIFPSDQMLQRYGVLKTYESMGKSNYIRDYQAFFLACGSNSRDVISTIQRSFSNKGYFLVDLEQSLKFINNQAMLDEADGIAKDAKTQLLSTVRPDIIIEYDYEIKIPMKARHKRPLHYNIVLLDAFTSKSIGSISGTGTTTISGEDKVAKTLNKEINKEFSELSKQVNNYFDDIEKNGREINFTVSTSRSSKLKLHDIYNSDGDTYADWIRNWVHESSKMGTANMQHNTNSEISFVNIRIKNHKDDGTQYNAYDFADDFRREFYQIFSVQVANVSQGLAASHIIIK